MFDYDDALCIWFATMRCVHGPCIAALRVLTALIVLECVHLPVKFAIDVRSSGVCMHVSCIDSHVHSCFELWSALSQSSWMKRNINIMYYYYILSKNSSPLPSAFDSDDLPNVFSDYFTEKIGTIRNNFPLPNIAACPDTCFAENPLLPFEPLTDEFVLNK